MIYPFFLHSLTLAGIGFSGENVVQRAMETDPRWLAVLAAGIFCWILSAAVASSLAEVRKRSPKLHFILGLLIPIAYGLSWTIGHCLTDKRAFGQSGTSSSPGDDAEAGPSESKKEGDAATGSAEKEEKMEAGTDGTAEEAAKATEHGGSYDREFFKKLQREGDPGSAGWRITFSGKSMDVIQIVECGEKAVAVKVPDKKGDGKTVRLPYQSISDVRAAGEK